MILAHVDHGLMYIAGRDLEYGWSAFSFCVASESKQAGFASTAAARNPVFFLSVLLRCEGVLCMWDRIG